MPAPDGPHGNGFPHTLWTVVMAAQQPTEESRAALERLCTMYWQPIYCFVRGWGRSRGYQAHDAEDLTQDFFTQLTAPDFLKIVDRSKGRFRSFLLAVLQNLLRNARRDANAQKRGGKIAFISTAAGAAEQEFLQLQAPGLSPEQLYQKQWAYTLLSQVMKQLRAEKVAEGKEAQFEATKIFLTGDKQSASYQDLAVQLGMTVDALKMAVHRMRRRYGELLREEIAKTVKDPAEVEDELQAVLAALSY